MVESPEENEVRHVRFGLLPKPLANVEAGKYWKVAAEIQTAHYPSPDPSPELDLDLAAIRFLPLSFAYERNASSQYKFPVTPARETILLHLFLIFLCYN